MSAQPTVLLAVSELMMQTRLTEALIQLGYDVLPGDSGEALRKGFAENPAALIVDLQSTAFDPISLVGQATAAALPVLAYGQHTKAGVLRKARQAGARLSVPRSELVVNLPDFLRSISPNAA